MAAHLEAPSKIIRRISAAFGAKGHTDANLLRPLTDRIGNQSINSDCCENQSKKSETTKHTREERIPTPLALNDSFHTHHAGQRKITIQLHDRAV